MNCLSLSSRNEVEEEDVREEHDEVLFGVAPQPEDALGDVARPDHARRAVCCRFCCCLSPLLERFLLLV